MFAFVRSLWECRKNKSRGFTGRFWRRWIGMSSYFYERPAKGTVACCGFQVNLGFLSIYYGV